MSEEKKLTRFLVSRILTIVTTLLLIFLYTTNGSLLAQETLPFFDNMESGENGWTKDGFWHQVTNPENISVDSSISPDLVTLPDADENGTASLPSAYSGSVVWWYGEDSTGTFIGSDYTGVTQSSKNGGKSYAVNSGSLITPSIDLTGASTAYLTFQTWWEIEGISPTSYDRMYVCVSTDGGETYTNLGDLNPERESSDSNETSDIPYSSGGSNASGTWYKAAFSLNDYVGHTVKIRFKFDTVDTMYNGFRGWLIDDVRVTDQPETWSKDLSAGSTVSDYQMLACPVKPSNTCPEENLKDDIGETYDTSKWRVGRWQDISTTTDEYDEYPDLDSVAVGKAYWFLSRDGGTVDVSGTPVCTDNDYSLTLKSGWNQIGCPFGFNVKWGRLIKVSQGESAFEVTDSESNTLTQTTLWRYVAGDYDAASIMEHGTGYWLKNLTASDVTLLVHPISTSATESSSTAASRSAHSDKDKPPLPPGSISGSSSSGSSGGGTAGGGGGCFIDTATDGCLLQPL